MKPYSEDLRTRIVRALQEEGTAKSAAARLFGVSLSSVKRYARIASRGESLKPRKGGGRPPKTDETTQKLQEEDGLQPKKRTVGALERDEWLRAAWRVALASKIDPKRLVLRTRWALTPR